MATITKRKDGRWQAIVDLPPDPKTGKRRRKWLYADGRPEVKRMATKLEAKIASGNFVEPSNLTVEGYLLQWLEDYCSHLSPATVAGYKRYIVNHIIPSIGSIKLQKLKPINVQRFYNDEKDSGYSNTTILQEHRILRKAMSDALKNDLIEKNPLDMVDAPRKSDFAPSVYNEEHYAALLAVAVGTIFDIPVLLAGVLGLRRGEVFGLRWNNIDLEAGTLCITQTMVPAGGQIHIKEPKNESSKRTITIPESLIKVLKQHKKTQLRERAKNDGKFNIDDCFVCCKENGQPVDPASFSRDFKTLLEKNNLQHIRFHDLRHFSATMMLKRGINTKIAAQRLGHSTPSTTQNIYQHVLADMEKEGAEKLNDLITIPIPDEK